LRYLLVEICSQPDAITERQASTGGIEPPTDSPVIPVTDVCEGEQEILVFAESDSRPQIEFDISRNCKEKRRRFNPGPQDAILNL
jgi:hypothetical protein